MYYASATGRQFNNMMFWRAEKRSARKHDSETWKITVKKIGHVYVI